MDINYLEVLINVCLASFGGFVKRLSDLEKQPGKKAGLSYYIGGSIISMFAGVVMYFICKNFDVPQFLTAGITALSGYMGSPVLDLLASILKKRIEKEIDKDK